MRASAPFSKAVLELAHGPPFSRIPHLRLHILARQSRPSSSSTKAGLGKRRLWLHPSTTNAIDTTSTATHGVVQDGENAAEDYFEAATPESQEPRTLRSGIEDILQERHPDRVLAVLLNSPEGRDFIRRADAPSFAAAFTSIDPEYFVESMKDIYRLMKSSLTTDPNYRWVRSFDERLLAFGLSLQCIMDMRREAGHKLTLEVYRHALDCARVRGHVETARLVMWKLMPNDGVVPDLHCYNYYIEACCWNHAWSKQEKFRLRVTPRILSIRAKYSRPKDLKGHRVGGRGLRIQMLQTFKTLVAEGHKGNEETFTSLMVAMGRENDLSGAKSILRSVWNINVDLLSQLDEEEIETPTYYEQDSPLRPSARLLFTVAHVFGSNNESAVALQLVDYISRQYDLRIPFDVWAHLFEWTFVLQLRRSKAKITQGQGLGHVQSSTLERLWSVMTDAPHHIKPDVAMYTLRASARRDNMRLDDCVADLRMARKLLDEGREEMRNMSKELLRELDLQVTSIGNGLILPAEWYNARRVFVQQSLKLERDLQLVIVGIRRLFKEFHGRKQTRPSVLEEPDEQRRTLLIKEWKTQHRSRSLEWERRRLPALLEEFAEYFPNDLIIKTTGGHINIDGKEQRSRVNKERWGRQTWELGIMRAVLDTDDHEQMLHGMQHLPQMLRDADMFCWHCKNNGHLPQNCPNTASNDADLYCSKCEGVGHSSTECPKLESGDSGYKDALPAQGTMPDQVPDFVPVKNVHRAG